MEKLITVWKTSRLEHSASILNCLVCFRVRLCLCVCMSVCVRLLVYIVVDFGRPPEASEHRYNSVTSLTSVSVCVCVLVYCYMCPFNNNQQPKYDLSRLSSFPLLPYPWYTPPALPLSSSLTTFSSISPYPVAIMVSKKLRIISEKEKGTKQITTRYHHQILLHRSFFLSSFLLFFFL